MTPDIHLKIAGVLLLALAALHVTFPRRFHWKEELTRLSLLNRQIFLVHCLFIGLLLVLMGLLSLTATDALMAPSPLARAVLGGMAFFWLVRLIVQFFVYSPALWRGDRARTAAHAGFAMFWSYLVAVYGWALWWQYKTL